MKLKQIYDEITVGRVGQISEAGLSRLLSMAKGKDFCIATAFRYSNTLQQNRALNREMLGSLNSQKMGGYQLIGHWQEAPDGIDYRDATPEQLTHSIEESVLFTKPTEMKREDFVKFCVGVARNYNQDAVIIGLESDGVYLASKDGSMDKIGNGISLHKTAQAYSRMKKKPNIPFVFEGILEPTSNVSKQLFKVRNIKYLI